MSEIEVKNKVQYLPTGKLKLHPDNPRFIKDRDFDILCQSIQENPGYFEARPLLCTPDFVVFAGNMRLRAAKHLKLKQVPVVVMDIDREKVRELMIRDNIQSGQWDTESLASNFEMEELKAWGMADFAVGDAAGPEAPAGADSDPFDDGGVLPKSQYGVIVICENEGNQESVFRDLKAMGYSCKIVVT